MLTTLPSTGLLDTAAVTASTPTPWPSFDFLPLDWVKQHLKVENDADDMLIALYLAAAIATLDGPAGWLGRALTVQTITLRFRHFDHLPAVLPYPPLIAIIAVEQFVDQAWLPLDYRVDDDRLIVTALDCYSRPGPLRVQYKAGMDGADGRTLPFPILAAILLMVGDLYGNRETVETGVRAAAVAVPMSTTVEALLAPFRVYG